MSSIPFAIGKSTDSSIGIAIEEVLSPTASKLTLLLCMRCPLLLSLVKR